MRQAILRERINHIWRELSFLIWNSKESSINQEIKLPNNYLLLNDGQMVTVELSRMDLYEEMEYVEYEAYHQVRSWKASDFRFDMTQNLNSFYLQAFIDKKLIGFIGCRRDMKDVHISNFVIDPKYQSQGIGAFLMGQLIEVLPQIKKYCISLEVRISNDGAQKFYKRFGFKKSQVKQSYYIDNKEDAVVMILNMR